MGIVQIRLQAKSKPLSKPQVYSMLGLPVTESAKCQLLWDLELRCVFKSHGFLLFLPRHSWAASLQAVLDHWAHEQVSDWLWQNSFKSQGPL